MSDLSGLRLALVGPIPPPAGGMAMQTRQLAELLTKTGAQVNQIATNPPYRPAMVARWPGIRAAFRLFFYICDLWSVIGRCELVHVMANSGWSWHLYAVPAIWVARLRRVPVVVNYRGGEAAKFLERSGSLVRFSMRQVARLVVPSGYLQEVFAGHGMSSCVVPNIVNLDRFYPSSNQVRSLEAPALLVARNLELIYDNATAIKAFSIVRAEYPSAQLTVAGTGPLESELRRLARDLGLSDCIHFPGRLDREEMSSRLRSSSVSINPSTVDNMPNSVLEALASGVPVVSSRVGGVPYMVEHGVTAMLVPPTEPFAMARAILEILRDRNLRTGLILAGLEQVKRYTWHQVGPQWVEVYKTAIAGGPRSLRDAVHD